MNLPHGHLARVGEDPSRYILVPGRHFRRPRLYVPGGPSFTWPLGTEGFEYSGNAVLGIHRYIGETDLDVNVIYLDEPRVVMTGAFPGNSGAGQMQGLLAVIRARTPRDGKILALPFIFPRMQFVTVENYSFRHDEDDRTRSIAYSITLVRHGAGRVLDVEPPANPPGNPPEAPPAGPSYRYFTVKDRYRNLRTISARVYKVPSRWNRLYAKNKKKLDAYFRKHGIPRHKFPTARLPLGMKIRY